MDNPNDGFVPYDPQVHVTGEWRWIIMPADDIAEQWGPKAVRIESCGCYGHGLSNDPHYCLDGWLIGERIPGNAELAALKATAADMEMDAAFGHMIKAEIKDYLEKSGVDTTNIPPYCYLEAFAGTFKKEDQPCQSS